MAASRRERILANWFTTMQTIANLTVQRLAMPLTLQSDNLLLLILSGGESPNPEDDTFSELGRILIITNVVKFRLGTETQVNAILQQIYAAAMADQNRGGLATQTEWVSHSEMEINEDGNQAQVTATYGVHYRHDPTDESVP